MIIPEVDLQWAPLPKLLTTRSNSHEEAINEQDAVFTVVCLLFNTLCFNPNANLALFQAKPLCKPLIYLMKQIEINTVVLSSLFPVVWLTVLFSPELHGRCLPRERLSWTVFPSPTLLMSRPYCSCFDISAPLTPCWGPVSLLSMPERVWTKLFRNGQACKIGRGKEKKKKMKMF